MKAALVSILIAIALASTVPPSKILSDTVEFIAVSPYTLMYSPVTFGSFFTEAPSASVISTAKEHQKQQTGRPYGWDIELYSITQTGAMIVMNTYLNFNYLKFKYVATQGDRLQVFQVRVVGDQGEFHNTTFFQQNLVKFDSSNLPNNVFIAFQIASYITDTDGWQFKIRPASSDGYGGKIVLNWAIPFNQLQYVISDDRLKFFQFSNGGYRARITMLIHRVNLPTETAVNGMGYTNDCNSVDGNYHILTDPNYNNLTVGAGQGIMGILGAYGIFMEESASATVFSVSRNFTPPATVTEKMVGYTNYCRLTLAGFYVVSCHSSCETCNGVFDHNCLTCLGGFPSVNGKCGCPPHVQTFPNLTCAPCAAGCVSCSSTFNCTSCQKQKYYRVPVVDSNNLCPCLPGYYENADLSCVRCPPDKYCATCELSGTSVVCASCDCAKYREKVGGACVCFSGYREYLDTPGPYCQKNP